MALVVVWINHLFGDISSYWGAFEVVGSVGFRGTGVYEVLGVQLGGGGFRG